MAPMVAEDENAVNLTLGVPPNTAPGAYSCAFPRKTVAKVRSQTSMRPIGADVPHAIRSRAQDNFLTMPERT